MNSSFTKRKLLFLILIIICFSPSLKLFAQTAIRKDFDSTTLSIITNVLSKSININLPDKITSELKLFAAQNSLPQNLVLKNSIALKMLFNKNLTYNEKKVYLEWAIQNYSTENIYLPTTYFKEALADLKQQ